VSFSPFFLPPRLVVTLVSKVPGEVFWHLGSVVVTLLLIVLAGFFKFFFENRPVFL